MEPKAQNSISAETLDAGRDVELRRQELAESLRVAGGKGSKIASQIGQQARPIVVSVAVVVSVSAVICVAIIALRPNRRLMALAPPLRQPSFVANVARAAAVWFLRAAVRRLATQLARR